MKALVKKLVVISVLLALMSGVNSYASNNVTEQSNISTNTVVTPTKNEAKPEVENKTQINNNVLTLVEEQEESEKNEEEINQPNNKISIIPIIIIVIILLIFFIKIIKNKMKPNKHMKKRKNRKEKREIDRIRDRKLNAMIKKMTIDDD